MTLAALRSNPRFGAFSSPTSGSLGRRRNSWFDHTVELLPEVPRSLASNFTNEAQHTQNYINAGAATLGTAFECASAEMPVTDEWIANPLFPDGPAHGFHIIGTTSATNVGLGLLHMYKKGQESVQAYEIGDTRGVGLHAVDTAGSLAQAGIGAAHTIFRISSIGELVAESRHADPGAWENLTSQSGFAGGVLGGALYTLAAIPEAFKAYDSFAFKRKLDKLETEGEKIDYLKRRLHADEDTLLAKEIKRLEKQDFRLIGTEAVARLAERNIAAQAEALAVERQTGILKNHISAMRKYQICGKGFTLKPEELEKVVRTRMSRDELQEHGKKLLVERLKAKKIVKMTRILGPDAVKELENPTDKIELAKIEISHSKKRKEYLCMTVFFVIGAVASFLLICGLSALSGPLPLLILTGVLMCVFLAEIHHAHTKLEEVKKHDTSAPGKYDEAWPLSSLAMTAASIAVALALSSSFGLALVLALVWMAMSYKHYKHIGERREKFMDNLMDKPALDPLEFAYILENGSKDRLEKSFDKAFDKLNWRDQQEIEEFLKAPEEGESIDQKKKRYLAAIAEWQMEAHKLSLYELATDLECHFGEIRFLGLPA